MSVVSLDHLTVSYHRGSRRTIAVEDVSLQIGAGEVVGLTGASGCGKSTLLHVLSGIVRDYSGSVQINGAAPDPHRHSIALVPQYYALLPWRRVRENILLPEILGKRGGGEDRLLEIVSWLEIAPLLDRYPSELSGGQKQRVALARAFVQQPDLLLLDEPFSALDMATAVRSRELMKSFQKRLGVTTLLVSHNLEELRGLTDRIVVMDGTPGRILSDGAVSSRACSNGSSGHR